MRNQKSSAILQIVSATYSTSPSGILHQFYLSVLFHIKLAFTRPFPVGSNKAIGGLLILPLLVLLVTACGKSSNDEEFSFAPSAPAPSAPAPGSGDKNNHFVDATFDGIEFIAIKHGCFMMGSDDGPEDERPAHEVCISRDFYLSKTEITQKQWTDTGMIDSKIGSQHFYGDNKPAVNGVTFLSSEVAILTFIKNLGKKTGGHYRLPTEAEWEYAARAGTTTKYFFGDSTGSNDEVLKEYAWFSSNSDSQIHEVATKKPNPWGLYDIYGNVYELTQDYYDKNYYQKKIKKDPINYKNPDHQIDQIESFLLYVIRGCGGYTDKLCVAKDLRSTARFYTETGKIGTYGFRLVREL
jgi:formylglycine-generating enzyme required for sulfatase activity